MYENIQNDDIPPPWMWPFEEEVKAWFEMVEERRKSESGTSDDIDDSSMMGNELSERFRRN